MSADGDDGSTAAGLAPGSVCDMVEAQTDADGCVGAVWAAVKGGDEVSREIKERGYNNKKRKQNMI